MSLPPGKVAKRGGMFGLCFLEQAADSCYHGKGRRGLLTTVSLALAGRAIGGRYVWMHMSLGFGDVRMASAWQ